MKDPDAIRRRQAAVLGIVRERIEEAGLEMVGNPYNLVTSDGAAQCMIQIGIPAALIEAQLVADIEPDPDDDTPTGETIVLDEATLDAAVEQARAAVAARTGGAA